MVYGKAEVRFLNAHWAILDAHYLKRQTVWRIARRTGEGEPHVRRVLREAWDMSITCADVAEFMERV